MCRKLEALGSILRTKKKKKKRSANDNNVHMKWAGDFLKQGIKAITGTQVMWKAHCALVSTGSMSVQFTADYSSPQPARRPLVYKASAFLSIVLTVNTVSGGEGSALCPKWIYPFWQQSWCQYWLGPLLRE